MSGRKACKEKTFCLRGSSRSNPFSVILGEGGGGRMSLLLLFF